MKPDRTASQRQSRARQALAKSGGRTITVKLGPEATAALDAFLPHMPVRVVAEIAIIKLAIDEYNRRRLNPPAPSIPPTSAPGPAD